MAKKLTAVTFAFVFLAFMVPAVVEVYSQATPYNPVYRDVPPPEGTEAPVVTIHTPRNGSSCPKNITLTFYVTIPKTNGDKSLDGLDRIYYSCSWKTTKTEYAPGVLTGSIDLSDAPGGNLSVAVYAVGLGYIETGADEAHTFYDRFEMTGVSTVSFIKDLIPPRIDVLSPLNATNHSAEVNLNFIISENASQIQYSLDGQVNQTIAGNITLAGLTNGEHNLTLYVADLAGNSASLETLFFNLNSPEPFPVVPVVTVISSIALCVGLVVYFKKRHRSKRP